MLENTCKHYLIGLGLTLLTIAFVEAVIALFPGIGWHFLTVLYVTILVMQIIFYWLTTNYNFAWSALSFIINFILWTLELVAVEKTFPDSVIFYSDNWKIGAYMLAGLLWVTNKIIIDKIFALNKSLHKHPSKIKA